ncbi:NHLP bacteriocin export ABC transporter permease/ATPase subunit [Bradyrhizobium sp. UFLA03-84]|uniref:NHLP bacteriocin export ABC transporter permease/ATPase subunit n=1 Tax=Bradyrhizobium sp. UFLA03-84 TaxID=418599 RepID=UPI000BAE0254|nr:NHLP bacteriocin export ABC transporter permease/ATPase subunit [Bradyrhizobium sp. UFLA03-84]PAY05293.1 NHLP bacteriocin export ABC transporter permease/ATPase subunit [Bradyrhizobium sp. UFLA03-84]
MSNPITKDEPVNERPIAASPARRTAIDPRHPVLLNERDRALEVSAGHIDIFAVEADGVRHHLLRCEIGEVILDLHTACERSAIRLQIVAVGGPDAEVTTVARNEIAMDRMSGWIARLSSLVASSAQSDGASELIGGETRQLRAGERCRGPKRSIVWARIEAGSVKVLDIVPELEAGSPFIPLIAETALEAGESGARIITEPTAPDLSLVWPALDRFHVVIVASLERWLQNERSSERQQLARRAELTRARALDALERLSEVVTAPTGRAQVELDSGDLLLDSCRLVADALGSSITHASRAHPVGQSFTDILQIARASRLRIRRVQLRDRWWKSDAGPLLGWHGPEGDPVALIRDRRGGYTMIDPKRGWRRPVNSSVASALTPEAVSFYKTLPANPLRYRDLLSFASGGLSASVVRMFLAIIAIGLLSLIPPLVTNLLVNSVIPRTEIDQLVVCAAALSVTAIAMAGLQGMQGLATIRLEGLLDYKLQAALIDRLLRLPASLFRDYTTGDLVDRSMGIEATRQIVTGRTLRGFTSALFGIFSVGLMFYYDLRLGSIALLLIALRAAGIVATSAVRTYYESKHFNLQGKVSGFVLQLIAGVSKLRVSNAASRALARWSGQFAAQKRYFIASQRAANVLTVFETTFPLLATLIIFAIASRTNSQLLTNLGAFLGFLAAFGQTTAAIGNFASSMSESLVVIPHLTRMQPILSAAAEIAEDRRPAGELTGEIEFSGVTFRYIEGGPIILDGITLHVSRGEYVAIVGPSGSGKSSLLRLLLDFERPEAGTIFYDGKALNTMETNDVRRQLGVVLQDTKLATGTLYENICGGVDLTLDKAWEAARLAALDADIRQMPMGMHTLVAEGINTLSGGQRQRVLIARALARSPRILLFDEATSALDNQTQAIVGASLERLNVTRIVIAHRLSTIRHADRIVMLVGGKIVQSGSYDELTSGTGPFAEFARRQLVA